MTVKYDVLIRTRQRKHNRSLRRTIDAWKAVPHTEQFNLIVMEMAENESLGSLTNRIIQKSTTDIVFFCNDDVTPSNNIAGLAFALETVKGNLVKANARIALNDSKMRRLHDTIYPLDSGFLLCAVKGDFLRSFKLDERIHCHEAGLFRDYMLNNNCKDIIIKDRVGVHHSANWYRKLLDQVRWETANKRYQSEQGLQPKEKVYNKVRMESEVEEGTRRLLGVNRIFSIEYRVIMLNGFNNYEKYLRGV